MRQLSAALVLALTLIPLGMSRAIDQTPTGFFYPTGTSSLGDYAGWLAADEDYYDGYYHLGWDIEANGGDPVYAVSRGTIVYISYSGWGRGNVCAVVQHALLDGTAFRAFYGHIRGNFSVGDVLEAGQRFAIIGPLNITHLHFGVRPAPGLPEYFGKAPSPPTPPYYLFVDPIDWITTRYPDTAPPLYLCEYKTQSPAGVVNKNPGDSFTCEVQYWNRGNTTWWNNPAQHPNDYVELKSVTNGGALCESFLYDPSWLNPISPCTMQQTSVVNDGAQYATFRFTGRVPDNASPGMHYAYFRPNHSTGGLLNDWGGVNFQVNVVIPPNPGVAADALIVDWQLGNVSVALNGNGFFDPDGTWESDWIHGSSANDFRLFTSGSHNDDFEDLCALSVRAGNWDELTTNGEDFWTERNLLSGWHGYTGGDNKHQFFMADATGDGRPDGIHVASHTGNVYVAPRVSNALVPVTNPWITSFCDGALNTHQFFAGDVTGDGKADILGRQVSTGNWWLARSDGSGFTIVNNGNPVLTNWTADALTNLKFQIVLSDLDADGMDELVCYRPEVGSVSWCDWNGTTFTKRGTLTTGWGVSSEPYRYRLLSRDLNKDGKNDFVLFKADGGNWYGGISTGTSITDRNTWRTNWGNSTDQNRYRPYLYDVGVSGNYYKVPADTAGTNDVVNRPPLSFRIVPNPTKGAAELWLVTPQTPVTALQVFDLQGRLIRTITDLSSLQGSPLWWDGRNNENERVPAGIYFLRLSTPKDNVTKRITVVR